MRGGRSFYEKKALILFADSVIAYIGGVFIIVFFTVPKSDIRMQIGRYLCKISGLGKGEKNTTHRTGKFYG